MNDIANMLAEKILSHVKAGKKHAFCVQMDSGFFVHNGRAKLMGIKVWIKLKNSRIHKFVFDNQHEHAETHANYVLLFDTDGPEANPVEFAFLNEDENQMIVSSADNAIGEILVIAEASTGKKYGIGITTINCPSGMTSKLILTDDEEFIETLIRYMDLFYDWN